MLTALAFPALLFALIVFTSAALLMWQEREDARGRFFLTGFVLVVASLVVLVPQFLLIVRLN